VLFSAFRGTQGRVRSLSTSFKLPSMKVLLLFGLIAHVFSQLNRTCTTKFDCLLDECVEGTCVSRDSRCDLFGCSSPFNACINGTRTCVPKDSRCDLFGCSSSLRACINETRTCVPKDSRCDLFGCFSPLNGCVNNTCVSKSSRCDLFGCSLGEKCQGTTCVTDFDRVRNVSNTVFGFAIGYFILVLVISLCCCCGVVFCVVKMVRAVQASKTKDSTISNLYSTNYTPTPAASPYYPPATSGQPAGAPYPSGHGDSTYSPPAAAANASPYPSANGAATYSPPVGSPAANASPYPTTAYTPPTAAYPATSQPPAYPPGTQ
jgi:hypothetical protein